MSEYEQGFREGKAMGERNTISWVKHMLEIVDCDQPETLEMFKEIIGKFDEVFQTPKQPSEYTDQELIEEWRLEKEHPVGFNVSDSNDHQIIEGEIVYTFSNKKRERKIQIIALGLSEAWRKLLLSIRERGTFL